MDIYVNSVSRANFRGLNGNLQDAGGGSGTSFRFAILSYIFLELRMEEASFVEIFKFQHLRSRQVPRNFL